MSFDKEFKRLILIEGGYSNHKSDRGGKTKYGITEKVARANGYHGDMRKLTLEEAKAIAKAQYWDLLRLDEINSLAPITAAEMFDTGYNMGQARAGMMLQRALNAMNERGSIWRDIKVDGLIGRVTIAALAAYMTRRPQGDLILKRALDCQQGERYLAIAETNEDQEDFMYGWFAKRIG